jgi:hypothetical protein
MHLPLKRVSETLLVPGRRSAFTGRVDSHHVPLKLEARPIIPSLFHPRLADLLLSPLEPRRYFSDIHDETFLSSSLPAYTIAVKSPSPPLLFPLFFREFPKRKDRGKGSARSTLRSPHRPGPQRNERVPGSERARFNSLASRSRVLAASLHSRSDVPSRSATSTARVISGSGP